MDNCKNICINYKNTEKMPNGMRYKSGLKWCTHCQIFINYVGVKCPCCRFTLRTKTKKSKTRMAMKSFKY